MKKGFTLIELLVVIAIIAILAGIVIIAVNPTRQVGQARDAQRRADTLTILNAVHQYYVDNGKFPEDISATLTQIGTSGADCVLTCDGDVQTPSACIDLTSDLVGTDGSLYLSAMPEDPIKKDTADPLSGKKWSGYAIKQDATNKRITVEACRAEIKKPISVTR